LNGIDEKGKRKREKRRREEGDKKRIARAQGHVIVWRRIKREKRIVRMKTEKHEGICHDDKFRFSLCFFVLFSRHT
jgi:hypothetical protein